MSPTRPLPSRSSSPTTSGTAPLHVTAPALIARYDTADIGLGEAVRADAEVDVDPNQGPASAVAHQQQILQASHYPGAQDAVQRGQSHPEGYASRPSLIFFLTCCCLCYTSVIITIRAVHSPEAHASICAVGIPFVPCSRAATERAT